MVAVSDGSDSILGAEAVGGRMKWLKGASHGAVSLVAGCAQGGVPPAVGGVLFSRHPLELRLQVLQKLRVGTVVIEVLLVLALLALGRPGAHGLLLSVPVLPVSVLGHPGGAPVFLALN